MICAASPPGKINRCDSGATTSGNPPTRVTTAGVPAASDSAATSPNPSSEMVGKIDRSAARKARGRSASEMNPTRRTESPMPAAAICCFSSSAKGPAPPMTVRGAREMTSKQCGGFDQPLQAHAADETAHAKDDRAVDRPTEALACFLAREVGVESLQIDAAGDDANAIAFDPVIASEDSGEGIGENDAAAGAAINALLQALLHPDGQGPRALGPGFSRPGTVKMHDQRRAPQRF